jgi:hypothetical protein
MNTEQKLVRAWNRKTERIAATGRLVNAVQISAALTGKVDDEEKRQGKQESVSLCNGPWILL